MQRKSLNLSHCLHSQQDHFDALVFSLPAMVLPISLHKKGRVLCMAHTSMHRGLAEAHVHALQLGRGAEHTGASQQCLRRMSCGRCWGLTRQMCFQCPGLPHQRWMRRSMLVEQGLRGLAPQHQGPKGHGTLHVQATTITLRSAATA
jgi:hypothetical protein